MDFSAVEKDSGVKFCMCVWLLSGQVFSHFGELWLAGSHGSGITSGMSCIQIAPGGKMPTYQSHLGNKTSWRGLVGSWNWPPWLGGAVKIGGSVVALGRMVGFASCKPADALV